MTRALIADTIDERQLVGWMKCTTYILRTEYFAYGVFTIVTGVTTLAVCTWVRLVGVLTVHVRIPRARGTGLLPQY